MKLINSRLLVIAGTAGLSMLFCSPATSTKPSAPDAPTGVSITPGSGHVLVAWTATSGAASYNVYYAIGTTIGKLADRVSTDSSSYDLTNLANDTQYAIAVSAVDATGESDLTPVYLVTPTSGAGFCPVPTGLSVVAGDASVTLTWNPVTGGISYNLYYKADSTVTMGGTRISGVASPCTLSSLVNGTLYALAVSAIDTVGESQLSTIVTVAPQKAIAVDTSACFDTAPAGTKCITGGTFLMGQAGVAEPVHRVTVSTFFMDSTEVPQSAYLALVGENPSAFTGDTNRPVETVTWFDAVLYCNARSKKDGRDTVYTYTGTSGTAGSGCTGLANLACDFMKNGYRLPTEAEYEYACRAGTTTECFWGDDSSAGGNYAWSNGNSGDSTNPVATKQPNAWGLYDMAGNIWEWCYDWYSAGFYASSPLSDPAGPASGGYRVVRGGSWHSNYDALRSAVRADYFPAFGSNLYGFRCVCR